MTGYRPGFTDEEQEYLDERIAIAEHNAGLSERDATRLVHDCLIHRFNPAYAQYYPLPAATPQEPPDLIA